MADNAGIFWKGVILSKVGQHIQSIEDAERFARLPEEIDKEYEKILASLCCHTPTCMSGEPLTTHCYACGKECKTCLVRTQDYQEV